MQEFLDFIYYLLSYLQFGYGGRNHPIGLIIFVSTCIAVVLLCYESLQSYFQIKKNSALDFEEKERLLNYHIRRIIMYAIVISFLAIKIGLHAQPVFY
jgi:hypothetical protein